jgi:hypothetical protein
MDMKDEVYSTNPHTKEELKENMWREILEFTQEEDNSFLGHSTI